MSTEVPFAAMAFPILRDGARGAASADARARGHSAGYLAGRDAAAALARQSEARREADHAARLGEERERLALAVEALTAAARAFRERTIPVLGDAHGMIAAAAVDIAEAVIGRELSHGPDSARSALDRALAGVDHDLVRVVRLNPADLGVLGAQTIANTGVEFVADPALARGDAVTEFADGHLDARIGTALARVRSELLGPS